jgi:hypothetical protein
MTAWKSSNTLDKALSNIDQALSKNQTPTVENILDKTCTQTH